MSLKQIVLILLILGILTFGADAILTCTNLINIINTDQLLFIAKKDDFQVGYLFQHSKEVFRRIGILRFKTFDANFKAGIAFGKDFSAAMKIDFNLFGLTPGSYSLFFLINDEDSLASLRIKQVVSFGNNVLNVFWYEEFKEDPFGFGRVCIKQGNFSYGLYRITNGVFPGVFLYSMGKTCEEGLFAGMGWFDGLAQFFAFRKNIGLKQSSIFFEPFLIVKEGSLIPAIRLENFGKKFSMDFFLMPGKVFLRASF
ncbi:hypothetical protein [Pseudothermotoga thermarum]|uniref:Uncharacterized protein n=1 Tax=Pseudothermotoga thermarum DSM 5069 TaxID=688269 RepID=F7YYJ1_9THEM|nr:hypothetical protein [Pseudothermotoga thermarum]AEH51020.1 hypothetical protein Theth_0936 [Pseudothermotoga thermarum DSM 5069]